VKAYHEMRIKCVTSSYLHAHCRSRCPVFCHCSLNRRFLQRRTCVFATLFHHHTEHCTPSSCPTPWNEDMTKIAKFTLTVKQKGTVLSSRSKKKLYSRSINYIYTPLAIWD